MKHKNTIAVIGGTGKSGKYLVQELINQGIHFKLLVRNPENYKIENPLVEVVHGDVNDFEAIGDLLEGCTALISTLGMGIPHSEPTVFTSATKNIIEVMQLSGSKRYIVVTGLNVDTPSDKKGPKTAGATKWMYDNYPISTNDRQKEYELLVKSELEWTLVRLPLIEQTDDRGETLFSLEDCKGDGISATDLAHFLIEQLDNDSFVRKAPFIWNT